MKKRNTGTGRQVFCIRTRARVGEVSLEAFRCSQMASDAAFMRLSVWNGGWNSAGTVEHCSRRAWAAGLRATPVVVAIVVEVGQKDRRHEPCARGHAFELQRLAARLCLVRHAVGQTRQARKDLRASGRLVVRIIDQKVIEGAVGVCYREPRLGPRSQAARYLRFQALETQPDPLECLTHIPAIVRLSREGD